MPPVRSSRNKKPPPSGFTDIEDTLLDYTNKMRDAQNASTAGKKKHETLWPIFQITHARSKYIYDLYYAREAISKELYDWLLKEGYADKNLIAKWKKQGYEKLCCLRCVQSKETNFGGTCVCRVPRAQLKRQEEGDEDGKEGGGGGAASMQCVNCGCRGCASSD
jgi:bud site selection protein 31